MNKTEQKAYALGIIGGELGIDFDNLPPDQLSQISDIADDAILDEPKTEIGKQMKKKIEEEKANSDGEYNKSFNFHKDLNKNKIDPIIIFILEKLFKYAPKLVEKDEQANSDLLGDVVSKMNELKYPVGYISNPFKLISSFLIRLEGELKGQLNHREDEIKALSIGVRHPKYDTLSPHLASFKDMDNAIKTLRKTFNFTEEDYRK